MDHFITQRFIYVENFLHKTKLFIWSSIQKKSIFDTKIQNGSSLPKFYFYHRSQIYFPIQTTQLLGL